MSASRFALNGLRLVNKAVLSESEALNYNLFYLNSVFSAFTVLFITMIINNWDPLSYSPFNNV